MLGARVGLKYSRPYRPPSYRSCRHAIASTVWAGTRGIAIARRFSPCSCVRCGPNKQGRQHQSTSLALLSALSLVVSTRSNLSVGASAKDRNGTAAGRVNLRSSLPGSYRKLVDIECLGRLDCEAPKQSPSPAQCSRCAWNQPSRLLPFARRPCSSSLLPRPRLPQSLPWCPRQRWVCASLRLQLRFSFASVCKTSFCCVYRASA